MCINYLGQVPHTFVGQLEVVEVEQLSEHLVLSQAFTDQPLELVTQVSFYIYSEWRFDIHHVSTPVSLVTLDPFPLLKFPS